MAPEKPFIEARVAVSSRQVAAVEALMNSQGALAVTLSDLADDPVLEPHLGETPLWPGVVVCGLFESTIPVGLLRAALSLAPGVEDGDRVHIEALEPRNWVAAWRDQFGPMRFGDSLWIVPHGEAAPDPRASIIRLEPGLAFGTGTHPSTRLCLEWIEAEDLRDREVIDYGCGSGVLGIAAALRGARSVQCVDNDPQAVTATQENARRNGVSDRVHAFMADEEPRGQADVVLANILAATLVELAPRLGPAVRTGGCLVLAGVLASQADTVARAYGDRFPRLARTNIRQWVRLAGHREGSDGE